MDTGAVTQHVNRMWDEEILPALHEFIRIPNQSPHFDRDWQAHGYMDEAVRLARAWVERQGLSGCRTEVLQDGNRTPLLLVEVAGQAPGTVLMYGHLDKQPPMSGWNEGLGPWTPVMDESGRLYGRGGADDGYAVFASVAMVKTLQDLGAPHPRVVMVIECSEESGSPDLPHYLQQYGDRIGEPGLVVCLDSGAGNYEQLWNTTSLRGMVMATLTIRVLREGIHSGMGGGAAPSPHLVARHLLERLEDSATGRILPDALQVDIPQVRREQARQAAEALGTAPADDIPFLEGVQPLHADPAELLLNMAWRASLSITAQEGLPSLEEGGNVLLPEWKLKLSMRIPPTLDAQQAAQAVKQLLERDPPFGAQVSVTASGVPGWHAPPLADWLHDATDAGSREFFGRGALALGVGGSIPFMHMIGERFPRAQFLITGVLGPNSNAHGPNEFLHVPYAKRLTAALTRLVSAAAEHLGG